MMLEIYKKARLFGAVFLISVSTQLHANTVKLSCDNANFYPKALIIRFNEDKRTIKINDSQPQETDIFGDRFIKWHYHTDQMSVINVFDRDTLTWYFGSIDVKIIEEIGMHVIPNKVSTKCKYVF